MSTRLSTPWYDGMSLNRQQATRITFEMSIPNNDNPYVVAVANAVDGTYEGANKTVAKLIEENITLNGNEVNKILASFLIDHSERYCVTFFGKSREYFKYFGAKVPRCSYNQLHSNGLAKIFYENCVYGKGIVSIDKALLNTFLEYFDIDSDSESLGSTGASPLSPIDSDVQSTNRAALRKAIEAKALVVMAGTGISLAIGKSAALSWNGLLNAIREMLNLRAPYGELISNAAWAQVQEPIAKAELLSQEVKAHLPHFHDYRQFVSFCMRNIEVDTTHALVDALRQLDLVIATTNYDLVLEHVLGRFEMNLTNHQSHISADHHREFIYHVHGVWFDSNSVVLSRQEYANSQYEFDYAIGKLFYQGTSLSQARSLLFVGSKDGIVDPHFRILFQNYHRYKDLKHFTLLKQKDLIDLMQNGDFAAAVNANRLIPVVYGENNADLAPFLLNLATTVAAADAAAGADVGTEFDTAVY